MLSCLVALAVWAGLLWGAMQAHYQHVYGTIYDESDLTVHVHPGDRFSLAVFDWGRSVGDSWTAQTTPEGLLSPVEKRNVMSGIPDRLFGPADGGGKGTDYFIFNAPRAGTGQVTLFNCFQGCDPARPNKETRSVFWKITVG